ncbi:MAG: hypothetical protein PHS53_00020 [Candidatus Pacebacteria bacterium]|nr:hypothetical protein [Candidatus Paceibacterota bacterium]MDD5356523.1 hypothetical protein [Candidatus Paceibacterota bacterium]
MNTHGLRRPRKFVSKRFLKALERFSVIDLVGGVAASFVICAALFWMCATDVKRFLFRKWW